MSIIFFSRLGVVRSSPSPPPACSRLFLNRLSESGAHGDEMLLSVVLCSVVLLSVSCSSRSCSSRSHLASGRRDCVRRRPCANDVTDYSSMPEGPTRRRSQRPPPSLTRGGLSAPRVASATAAAPTRAGTTRAAEQADARSIAAARSSARTGHSTSSDRRSSAEE